MSTAVGACSEDIITDTVDRNARLMSDEMMR